MVERTVFVIRDFEVDKSVGLTLQFLAEFPPKGTKLSIPGIPGAAEGPPDILDALTIVGMDEALEETLGRDIELGDRDPEDVGHFLRMMILALR